MHPLKDAYAVVFLRVDNPLGRRRPVAAGRYVGASRIDTVGDGWAHCALGHRHWGLFGAAGLLVVWDRAVLLQLRAGRVHHGGTWSVPGGARNDSESPTAAALRESWEEIGLPASSVTPLELYVDDHGGWSYTTVVAGLRAPFEPHHNFESAGMRWVPQDEVARLPLHHGFARSWPDLRGIIAERHEWSGRPIRFTGNALSVPGVPSGSS